MTVYFVAKQFYYIGVELSNYSIVGYRALGRVVDRAGILYAGTKRQLGQLRTLGRGEKCCGELSMKISWQTFFFLGGRSEPAEQRFQIVEQQSSQK